MVGQIVVEFGGDPAHLRQAVVRNVREIMMLDVISKIVDEEIQRTVIAGRRLALREEIVLWNEVSRQGMKPQPEEGSTNQIHQWLDAEEVEDQCVEADLDEEVDDFECQKWDGVLDEWANAVYGWMDGQPEQLRRPVTKQATFERRRNVYVLYIVPVSNTAWKWNSFTNIYKQYSPAVAEKKPIVRRCLE